MSTPGPSKHVLRCHHCGREVSGTVHTRTSYNVDYYALHTGEVEPVTLHRADETLPSITVLRLLRPINIFTCADCYRKPAVREQREALFRPEAASIAEESRGG